MSEAGDESPMYAAATGIRQGCHLSPFLFIVVLTHLFEDLDKDIRQQGVSNDIVSHRRPVYDLEYADDVALFHAHLPSLQALIRSPESIAPKYGSQMRLLKTVPTLRFTSHCGKERGFHKYIDTNT